MYVSQRALLYPGASSAGEETARWGTAVSIDTPDGERLHALFRPATDGRPTLLFFHGNADRISNYSFLDAILSRRDIGFLAISYRGYPGSTGSPTEEGLLADGVAAFDWLSTHTRDPIAVLGQSLGTGVAVHVAAQRPVAAVVLLSAYDSMMAVAQQAYFFLPVAPLLKDTFRSDLKIVEVSQPKLFIHGLRDTVVPLSHGESLFEVAQQPKQMIALEPFGHNDIWSMELADVIADFVENPGQAAAMASAWTRALSRNASR